MSLKQLQQHNQILQQALQKAADEVAHNEATLSRFFATELRLLACSRLSELVQLLLTDFKVTFHLNAVSLLLFDPEEIAAELLGDISTSPCAFVKLEPNQSLLQQLYPDKELRAGHISSQVRQLIFPHTADISSAVMLPLIRHNCLIGGLHLGSDDPARYTLDYRYDYLGHLASVTSVCIENCISQENLQRLSVIDTLTKTHNRRSLDQELIRETARANRNGEPLSCILLDLDHFKQINDTYGHQSGDRVLRGTGELLQHLQRKTDIVARYGGEEFAILLPGCPPEQTVGIAESLRAQLARQVFCSVTGETFQVTASLGLATYWPAGHLDKDSQKIQAEKLIQRADQALYQAKHNGRNQVQGWSSVPATSPASH